MKRLFMHFFLTIFLLGISQLYGQGGRGFRPELIGGVNLSQMEGDDLSGYRKLGLLSGVQINYDIFQKAGLAVGLIYEQKGSSDSFSLFNSSNNLVTTLHFLSVPLDICFLAGYNPKIERHRLRYNFGISIGRLFDVVSDIEKYASNEEAFQDFEIAGNLGLTYFLSKNSGVGLRWKIGISQILKEQPNLGLRSLRNYLFSVQYIYSI